MALITDSSVNLDTTACYPMPSLPNLSCSLQKRNGYMIPDEYKLILFYFFTAKLPHGQLVMQQNVCPKILRQTCQ